MKIEDATRLHQLGDLEGASQLYKKLLNEGKQREKIISVMNYGSILRKSGKVDEAINLYNEFKGKEKEPGIMNNLGNCLLEKEQVIEALTCFRKSMELSIDYVEPRVSVWKCLSILGLHELQSVYALRV